MVECGCPKPNDREYHDVKSKLLAGDSERCQVVVVWAGTFRGVHFPGYRYQNPLFLLISQHFLLIFQFQSSFPRI